MASSPDLRLVLSCEHATARVPARYAALFRGAEAVLATHRALDIGSAELAAWLGRRTHTRVHRAPVTRLLVDCNRSEGHPGLFSEFSRRLSRDERRRLVQLYYLPYRQAVTAAVGEHLAAGATVLHVSVHSFVRRLDGVVRNADVGLLYDPSRPAEKSLCRAWQELLAPERALRVRRNYPYRGVADGLVTSLRRRFETARYIGMELELCQDLFAPEGSSWRLIRQVLADSLVQLLGSPPSARRRR